MLTVLALTLTAAADCVPEGELIVIQDDLMRVSTELADDLEIEVESMTTDDRVPWSNAEGEIIEADAATLEEGALRKGYFVYEDHVMLRAGSTGLTIEEGAFLIAGMGVEVVVFMTSDFTFDEGVIFATSLVAGPLEDIEGLIPEGAVQLIPSPTCE